MVFYRKYRPQTLDELIGQEAVKTTLKNAHAADRLSHAYLFVGPRGTGKTSTARILAKMVNCKKGGGDNCEICQSITDGSNMDLIEIDAASNRGIEDIRDLREKIKLSPSGARKKVYIIDEVHMLSTDAFNALLKTLEEPPSHVIFILATTEVQKVPTTILSRTQRLDFKLASIQDLVKALEKIVIQEKLVIDSGVLEIIAKRAEGSFRDAVKLLDQVSSDGGKLTTKKVEERLTESDFYACLNLLESIFKQDSKGALGQVLLLVESSSPKDLTLKLMDILHLILLIKNGLEEIVKLECGEDKSQRLTILSFQADLNKIISTSNFFQEALEKMRNSAFASFPLEIAVLESCSDNASRQPDTVDKVEAIITEKVESLKDDQVKNPEVANEEVIPEPIPSEASVVTSEGIIILKDKWNYILETVKPDNFSLEALLKLVNIAECSDSRVVLEVPYSFHQRILEAPKSRDLLESVFSDVLGKSVKVSTILGKRPIRTEDIANIEVAADDEIIRVASEIFNS